MRLKLPKVLIVGVSGFLGKKIYAFLKDHYSVIGTSRSANDHHLPFDLTDSFDKIENYIDKDTIVLLLAAISSPDICQNKFNVAFNINVKATQYFIEKCLEKNARIVFCSSDAVYGETNSPVTEISLKNPLGVYAIMKSTIEDRFKHYPLFKALRFSYIYSNNDKFMQYLDACTKKSIVAEIFDPFDRAIIHFTDVLEGIKLLIINWSSIPESIINFGGPEIISRSQMTQTLQLYIFNSLKYNIEKPNADFFKNRARIINMHSPILEKILGRKCKTLVEVLSNHNLDASL